MEALRTAIANLEATSRPLHRDDDRDPLVTIVFDEAGSLTDEVEKERFISLNRIISAVSDGHQFWYLF